MTTYAMTIADDRTTVTVKFMGRLTAEDGKDSARRVATLLQETPRHLVLDIREMSGYETDARVAWQEVLMPQRKNILGMTFCGGGALVRVGATMLALVLQVPSKFVA
jgi:hypothetical protein